MSITIIEALNKFKSEGRQTLDIYYAEDIKPGDEYWFADVMQDEINEFCHFNWTWTVISKKEYEKESDGQSEEDMEDISEWEIVVDKPFSDEVVKEEIDNWLKERDYKFHINIISFDDAKGSGYIKTLRERLEKHDI